MMSRTVDEVFVNSARVYRRVAIAGIRRVVIYTIPDICTCSGVSWATCRSTESESKHTSINQGKIHGRDVQVTIAVVIGEVGAVGVDGVVPPWREGPVAPALGIVRLYLS